MRWSKAALAFLALAAVGAQPSDDNMTGKRELRMASCPSAVEGATTTLVELPDGVQLTVTGRDEPARRDIWRRAQEHGLSAWDWERGSQEHTGAGTGSGRYGFCPGILASTTLDVELLPTGARLTVRADRPVRIEELKRVTRQRLEWLRRRKLPTS